MSRNYRGGWGGGGRRGLIISRNDRLGCGGAGWGEGVVVSRILDGRGWGVGGGCRWGGRQGIIVPKNYRLGRVG